MEARPWKDGKTVTYRYHPIRGKPTATATRTPPRGFAAMWGKLLREAIAKKVISRRFTFHDLRARYATRHKDQTGQRPDLHASPTTTAKVYERSGVARRTAL
jgi:integrase